MTDAAPDPTPAAGAPETRGLREKHRQHFHRDGCHRHLDPETGRLTDLVGPAGWCDGCTEDWPCDTTRALNRESLGVATAHEPSLLAAVADIQRYSLELAIDPGESPYMELDDHGRYVLIEDVLALIESRSVSTSRKPLDPYLVGYDPEEHVGTAPEHALHFDPDCEECAYLARPTRETLGATSREAGPGCLHHDLAGNPAHVPGCPEAATSREAGLDAILHDFDLRASKEYNRSESSRAIWAEAAALVRARLATSPAEHTGDEGG